MIPINTVPTVKLYDASTEAPKPVHMRRKANGSPDSHFDYQISQREPSDKSPSPDYSEFFGNFSNCFCSSWEEREIEEELKTRFLQAKIKETEKKVAEQARLIERLDKAYLDFDSSATIQTLDDFLAGIPALPIVKDEHNEFNLDSSSHSTTPLPIFANEQLSPATTIASHDLPEMGSPVKEENESDHEGFLLLNADTVLASPEDDWVIPSP